jgi:hypothetical protein
MPGEQPGGVEGHKIVYGNRGTERGDDLVSPLLERLVADSGDPTSASASTLAGSANRARSARCSRRA